VTLNPVIGLADRTGESSTTLDAEEVAFEGSLFLQIEGTGGVILSCGDLMFRSPASSGP
jgi:hypothetical protein